MNIFKTNIIKLNAFFLPMIFLFSSVLFTTCKEEQHEPTLPFSYNVSVLLNTKILDFQLRKIDYYLDVAVIKGSKTMDSIGEYSDLPDSVFKFKDYYFNNKLVHFQINKIEYLDTIPEKTFYTALLIDQSANGNSYELRDPYNYRYENINAFLKNLSGQGHVILSACARNGELANNVLTIYGDKFISHWNKEIATNLLALTHQTGGTSSINDGLYGMVDFMAKNAPDSNRSVTVVLINKDDGKSIHSIEQIKSLAVDNHIRINFIFLSYNINFIDFRSFTGLAEASGGFCELGGIWELSSSFFMMNKLLKRDLFFYRIHTTLTIESPQYFNPNYMDVLKTVYDTNSKYDNYLYFVLEKP